jgi:hypothetical protein
MRKPLLSLEGCSDIRVGLLRGANYGRGAEMLSTPVSLLTRFNPRLVGFGIVSSSLNVSKINDQLIPPGDGLCSPNQKEGK